MITTRFNASDELKRAAAAAGQSGLQDDDVDADVVGNALAGASPLPSGRWSWLSSFCVVSNVSRSRCCRLGLDFVQDAVHMVLLLMLRLLLHRAIFCDVT